MTTKLVTKKVTHWLYYISLLEDAANGKNTLFPKEELDAKKLIEKIDRAITNDYAIHGEHEEWMYVTTNQVTIGLTETEEAQITSLLIFAAMHNRR